jgi:ribosomal protein S18 acetylase RimI-like enzyme
MRTEFRKVIISREIRKLLTFDQQVFPKSDRFSEQAWRKYESYWMIINGVTVGCCAFHAHMTFRRDISGDALDQPMRGSLYITTTGVLPKYQGLGLGRLLKSWQIAFARYHGFGRVVTNTRSRNSRMIALNKEFNFRIVRVTPGFYSRPTDAAVVMELRLAARRQTSRTKSFVK